MFVFFFFFFYVCAVPPRETNSKLRQNERFPLLGGYYWRGKKKTKHENMPEIRGALWMFLTFLNLIVAGRHFLVMPVVRHRPTEVGFLCLLCETDLSEDTFCAHVFSRQHVAIFLVSIFILNTSHCIIFPGMVTVVLLSSLRMSCDYLGYPVQCTYLT